MNTVKLNLNFNNGLDFKNGILADEVYFVNYVRHFIDGYVESEKGYRIGKGSQKVIFEGRTYEDINDFAKKVNGAKELENSVLQLNPQLNICGFSRFTWISLDEFIFSNFEDIIIEKIKSHKNLDLKIPAFKLSAETYDFNGNKVVFCVYKKACSGTEVFAVPVEIAERINIEDFDNEKISRYEDFLDDIEPYKLSHISFFNND